MGLAWTYSHRPRVVKLHHKFMLASSCVKTRIVGLLSIRCRSSARRKKMATSVQTEVVLFAAVAFVTRVTPSPRLVTHHTSHPASPLTRDGDQHCHNKQQPEVRWGGVDTLCSVGRESHRSDYHSVSKHKHWPYIAQKWHGTTKFIYFFSFKIYSNLMCRCQCQCVDF